MTRIASFALLIGGLVAAITGGRVWVRFTVDDPVLGPSARAASGYAVSSALSAACIVALAAGLAALLTRRSPRTVALLVLAVDAGWGSWLTLRVLRDPARALSTSGSPDLGLTATGELSAQGAQTTFYVYVFFAAALVAACAALVVAVTTRVHSGRAPADSSAPRAQAAQGRAKPAKFLSAAERERRASAAAWDDLSRGNDPTTTGPQESVEDSDHASKPPGSLN